MHVCRSRPILNRYFTSVHPTFWPGQKTNWHVHNICMHAAFIKGLLSGIHLEKPSVEFSFWIVCVRPCAQFTIFKTIPYPYRNFTLDFTYENFIYEMDVLNWNLFTYEISICEMSIYEIFTYENFTLENFIYEIEMWNSNSTFLLHIWNFHIWNRKSHKW